MSPNFLSQQTQLEARARTSSRRTEADLSFRFRRFARRFQDHHRGGGITGFIHCVDAYDVWVDVWDPSLDEGREGFEGRENIGTKRRGWDERASGFVRYIRPCSVDQWNAFTRLLLETERERERERERDQSAASSMRASTKATSPLCVRSP